MKIKAISPHVLKSNQNAWYQKYDWIWELVYWKDKIVGKIRRFLFAHYNSVKTEQWGRTEWHDSDDLMFHTMFQILKDYVEIELAQMWKLSAPRRRFERVSFWKRRNPADGLRYLEWEIQQGEDSPEQSESAKSIRDLYLWYTVERPMRINLSDIMFDPDGDGDISDEPEPQIDQYKYLLKFLNVAEIQQYQEDTEKMIELAQVRQMMWT